MRRFLLIAPLAAGLPFFTPSAAPVDRDVHEAMEVMEEHLEALSDASISALTADAGADLGGFTSSAQAALDGLALALHPILLSSPEAPEPTEGQAAPTEAELHARELAYQRALVANLDRILATEQALAQGDWDAVQAGVDALYEQEDSGHEEFRVKKRKRGR